MTGLSVTLAGAGFFLAYQLYQREVISWSGLSDTMTPALIGVLVGVLVGVFLLGAFRNSRVFHAVFSGFVGLVLGFTSGVVGPGVLGE